MYNADVIVWINNISYSNEDDDNHYNDARVAVSLHSKLFLHRILKMYIL